MKKSLLAGAAVIVLSVVVAACGGGGGSSSSDSTGATAQDSAASFPELRWAYPPIRRADPVSYFSSATTSLVAPVEQSLMSYNAEGKVEPELAESVENPNPTTYIYRLKKGAKFSDGKPVTGEDVLFSLQRNMGSESQTATNYENVASISLQGSDTIVFKLKQPDVSFPNLPAFSGQILQKAAALKGGKGTIGTSSNLPIGSGPYKFTSFNPEQGATLELNPYWEGEKPPAEKIAITFVKTDAALALAMRSGEVDGDFFITSKRSFEFPGVELLSSPGALQIALSMNTIVPPFDDVHVRKAIAYATDREGMAQAIYAGGAEITNTLTPPALFGNIAPESEVEEVFDTLPKYEFDLDAAKAEMEQSKYPDGASITFQSEPGLIKIGQILQPDLAKIGLDLNVEEMSESRFIETLYGPRDKLSLAVNFYGATYPDPSSLLTYFLSPEQAKVNGLNSANYKNPEIGELLAQQNMEADGEKRLQLIAQIYEAMGKDFPYVPLFSPEQFMVISDEYEFEGFSQWTTRFDAWPLLVRPSS